MSRTLCKQIEGCDAERFDPTPERERGPYAYYGAPVSFPIDLNATQQALLLADAESVCSAPAAQAADWDACRWTQPDVGIYAVVACVEPPGEDVRVCQLLLRGLLDIEWQVQPLDSAPRGDWRWALGNDTGFTVGGTADLWLESPVNGSTALLVRCGPAVFCLSALGMRSNV